MDFESCNPAAQFAIQQSQNSFVIPNATPFIEFGLNMLATGHVGPTIRIFDVTQPLSFAVFNRVEHYLSTDTPKFTVGQVVQILQSLKVQHFFNILKNAGN